jgi:hypothetical protein
MLVAALLLVGVPSTRPPKQLKPATPPRDAAAQSRHMGLPLN